MFNLDDLSRLQNGYRTAKLTLSEVTWRNGYPHYPDEIRQFMLSLGRPPWVPTESYDIHRLKQLMDEPHKANATYLQAILTAISRSERYGDGNWLSFLESDLIGQLILRGRTLVQER